MTNRRGDRGAADRERTLGDRFAAVVRQIGEPRFLFRLGGLWNAVERRGVDVLRRLGAWPRQLCGNAWRLGVRSIGVGRGEWFPGLVSRVGVHCPNLGSELPHRHPQSAAA